MPTFTEADIRAHASGQSYSRGVSYYEEDAVLEVIQRDNVLTAGVSGSDYEPYEITVVLDETGGIRSADCTCPYDHGGYCKHIVAVLLAALHDAESIEVQVSMETLLAGLSEAQLRQLIMRVAEGQPAVADAIEREVTLLRATTPAAPPSAPTGSFAAPAAPAPVLDLAAVGRELRRSFRQQTSRDHGDWYDDDEGYIDADAILAPHLDRARRLLTGGNPAVAAELLAAVIEEWGECIGDLEEWIYEASEEGIAQASGDVDALLAECLLSQPLSTAQRQAWRTRIEAWADDSMRLSISDLALETWWDYPPLVAVLQGQVSERGAWEAEPPDEADALVLARLSILERQGRTQEYLNLAQAEGQFMLYLVKLVKIGEIERAVRDLIESQAGASECLHIARLLVEQGRPGEALTVAGHGLASASGHGKAELARWLIPLAEQQGRQELALSAARVAFVEQHTLGDYQVVERLAGNDWPKVKQELLAGLQGTNDGRNVAIYLYERMLPEAMAIVDGGYFYGDLVNVVEAAAAEYPDWAIQKCKRNAEPIMNGGKADRYADAARWLRRAREIYAQHNRLAEWRPYISGLLETHGRKYKLVPMLRELR